MPTLETDYALFRYHLARAAELFWEIPQLGQPVLHRQNRLRVFTCTAAANFNVGSVAANTSTIPSGG